MTCHEKLGMEPIDISPVNDTEFLVRFGEGVTVSHAALKLSTIKS